jgi:hypothetical protein
MASGTFGSTSFFAVRAVIPVDRVFRDHRLDDFGDVFDDLRATALAALQLAAAVGTALQPMRLATIDLDRPFTTNTGVSRCGTGLLASCVPVRLGVDRDHARRRCRVPRGRAIPQFRETPVERECE